MNAPARTIGTLLALAVAVPALFQDTSKPPSRAPAPRVVRWSHGDTTKRLMPADQGFCYISGIGGNFEGAGEAVRIWVDDGMWWVGGHSCQPSLWIDVTCVSWPGARKPAVSPSSAASQKPEEPAKTPTLR